MIKKKSVIKEITSLLISLGEAPLHEREYFIDLFSDGINAIERGKVPEVPEIDDSRLTLGQREIADRIGNLCLELEAGGCDTWDIPLEDPELIEALERLTRLPSH